MPGGANGGAAGGIVKHHWIAHFRDRSGTCKRNEMSLYISHNLTILEAHVEKV